MNDAHKKIADILEQGLNALSVNVSEEQKKKLLTYVMEFHKWNQAYNLSAIRDIEQMVSRHLLDSLSVAPFFDQAPIKNFHQIIDVGTGGGLPGIPLAIIFPERQFTLLDSNGKKTRFLFHIKTLLKLDNVTVINRRIEQYQPEEKFQAVISRAFASLQDMTELCAHLLDDAGAFLAMKGVYPEEELNQIQGKAQLEQSHKLEVPNTEGERHLLVLRPIRR